jgi:adenosylcobinamide-phosphate synthase
MTFLSLLAALLLEQAWPLRQGNPVQLGLTRYAHMLESQLNGGERRHGVIAWLLAVLPVIAVVVAVYYALRGMSPPAAWLWNIVVLYFTLGFRQFSHYFTEIEEALRAGDLAKARELLGRWRGESAQEFSAGETARVAIEQGLLASHRHVFGTLFWFLVLGVAGAALYYLSAALADKWGSRAGAESAEFGRFAASAFHWIDWLPVRLTALSFAVAGDFMDAFYCWRTQAAAWAVQSHGILLAAGGGALGVRLGDTLHQHGTLHYRPEMGLGDEADADYMRHAVGLIWRALVLWMFLILLVSLAHALG